MNDAIYRLVNTSPRGFTLGKARKNVKEIISIIHPDKNEAPEAGAVMAAVILAYKILSDPRRKEVYDRTGMVSPSYNPAVAVRRVKQLNKLLWEHKSKRMISVQEEPVIVDITEENEEPVVIDITDEDEGPIVIDMTDDEETSLWVNVNGSGISFEDPITIE